MDNDDHIGTDCMNLIISKIQGKIDFDGYISELELLNHKYPSEGFDKSVMDLQTWKAKQNE